MYWGSRSMADGLASVDACSPLLESLVLCRTETGVCTLVGVVQAPEADALE